MPRKLNFLEGAVRNLMKTYIQRGKVDVYITYEDYTLDNGALKYNRELASEYITCLKQMQQDFDLDYDIKVSTLSRYPEVLVMEEQSVDEEALWESLEPPLREACEKFVQTNWKQKFPSCWKTHRSTTTASQQKSSCFQTKSAMMRKPSAFTATSGT